MRRFLGSSLVPRVSVRDVTSVTDVTCHAVTNVTNKSESVATGWIKFADISITSIFTKYLVLMTGSWSLRMIRLAMIDILMI